MADIEKNQKAIDNMEIDDWYKDAILSNEKDIKLINRAIDASIQSIDKNSETINSNMDVIKQNKNEIENNT